MHQQLGAQAGSFFEDPRKLPILLGKQGVDCGRPELGQKARTHCPVDLGQRRPGQPLERRDGDFLADLGTSLSDARAYPVPTSDTSTAVRTSSELTWYPRR